MERKLILEGPIFHWTMIVGGRLTTKLFESPITLPNTSPLRVCPTGSIPSIHFPVRFWGILWEGLIQELLPIISVHCPLSRGSKMMVAYLYRHLVTGISEKTPMCSTKKRCWHADIRKKSMTFVRTVCTFCSSELASCFWGLFYLLVCTQLLLGIWRVFRSAIYRQKPTGFFSLKCKFSWVAFVALYMILLRSVEVGSLHGP